MAASAVTPLLSNHQTPLRQQKGYSIIELSIALAIISIILVTVLAGVQRILRSNSTNEDLKNINLLASKLTVMLSNVQTTAGIAQANLVNLRVFEGFRVNGTCGRTQLAGLCEIHHTCICNVYDFHFNPFRGGRIGARRNHHRI